jgi:hypothetical protein
MPKASRQSFKAFLDRQRAIHGRSIRAFQHQPLCIRLDASFIQHGLQRHAGIHDVVHHAVGELAAVELRAAPLHAGIRRAFEEVDLVHARHALDVVHREHQRLVHEAVDHQPVIGGIDLRDAGVMPLEAQARWRDDAVEFVQRREIHRGSGDAVSHDTSRRITFFSNFEGMP